MLPAAGLVLLIVTLLPHSLCQHHSLLAEIQGWPTNPGDVANSPDATRPTCVLINNYCGKIVPGTGMRKECCGDLTCYKNKCRKRTCC